MRSTLRRGAVVTLGAAAALSLGLGSAAADPGFTPDADDIVGSGSDTIQFVTDAIADGYVSGSIRMASWNATNPATGESGDIIEYRAGDTIPRPNGSSGGINALLDTNNALDFARSSRPSDGAPDEDTLAFIPFAEDGLGYIVDDGSFVPNDLSAADLRDIYTCTLPGYEPKVPQEDSGTRDFFLDSIELDEADLGSCVEEVQEHDASPVDGNDFALAPFSTARYSFNPADPANPPSDSVVIADGSGAFSVTRQVFHVVKDSDWVNDPTPRQELVDVFGPTGVVCDTLAATGSFQGFTSIGSDCGVALPDA